MQRTRLLIRACVAKLFPGAAVFYLLVCGGVTADAQKMIRVPTAPPTEGKPVDFHDDKYGVHFSVPPGWKVSKKDREVSTFHLDARSATRKSQLRAVASLEFNPFPQSVFSGALLYYSVERHASDASCAAETKPAPDLAAKDVQNIGGMNFAHGHDEHGGICVEARDEVYTAFRKGACYRFDLAVNTFCAISSGAQDLSITQMRSIEQRMTEILSSVSFDWDGSGPQTVPVPEIKNRPKIDLPAPRPGQEQPPRIPLTAG